MEHTEYKTSEQSVDSKGQSVLAGVKSSATKRQGIVGIQHLKSDLASVTPEKTSGSSGISCNKETNQIPEKYWSILEFFNRMTSSLRLLGLHKKTPTFQNICCQVERLTGRKFEYKHLAQIKYILPEAIQINKILIHDTETMCMKPDINVTLLFYVVEGHSEQSAFIALGHLFASRLKNFISTHSEGQTCDIPEAVLPEPFNRTDITIKADRLPVELSTSNKTEQVKLSHFGPSFCSCFSVKAIGAETEKTRPFACPLACSSSNSDYVTDQEIEKPRTASDLSVTSLMNTSSVLATMPEIGTSDSTPMKGVTEDDDLMLETPALPTPKRAMPTCEDKEKTMINEFSKAGSQTAKRSLDFSKLDHVGRSLNMISHEMEQSTTLPSTFGQMKIPEFGTPGVLVLNCCNPLCSASLKNVILKNTYRTIRRELREAVHKGEKGNFCNVKDQTSNQGYMRADEQTSVCLSDLILTIHHIFQSVNCCSITKEELVHKIIMNNCDIDENSNIEGQIEHLEKLVPDWIHKQMTTSGDMLYNISMVSDLNSVRERVISI